MLFQQDASSDEDMRDNTLEGQDSEDGMTTEKFTGFIDGKKKG
jgi:hypothetical protein